MDRTFAPNYTVVDNKRVYQDRDKANGISGTSLVAEDRTKVEEELIGGIIEKAGLTPDRADLSQVNKALSIMYAAYERSIAPYSADVAKRLGGYPLNAVVCDPSAQGVFWRSTVPKNTGVPGAENSGWVLFFDGYATQDWVSSSYITGNSGAPATSLNAGVIDSSTRTPSLRDGSGNWHVLQPYGDYATNTALSQGLATKQPTLGFVPVQQGGGANQGTNKVFLGWATDGSGVRVQVDTTDLGALAFVHKDFDWGTFSGGFWVRVGKALTQYIYVDRHSNPSVGAADNGRFYVAFPIAYVSAAFVSVANTAAYQSNGTIDSYITTTGSVDQRSPPTATGCGVQTNRVVNGGPASWGWADVWLIVQGIVA